MRKNKLYSILRSKLIRLDGELIRSKKKPKWFGKYLELKSEMTNTPHQNRLGFIEQISK